MDFAAPGVARCEPAVVRAFMTSFRGIVVLSLGVLLCVWGCGDETSGSTMNEDASVDFDPGSATLTITLADGDQTWEFDSFGCAFGHEATMSEEYSFSSSSVGGGGTDLNLQMQAEIIDPQSEGRYEGEGVLYLVYINEISADPSLDYVSSTDTRASSLNGETVVLIDGDTITATGMFDDATTEGDSTQFPGTLTGRCGAQSRR